MNKRKGKHAISKHEKRKNVNEYSIEDSNENFFDDKLNELHANSVPGINITNVVKETDSSDELVKLKRSYTKQELEEMIEVIKEDIKEERRKDKKRQKGRRYAKSEKKEIAPKESIKEKNTNIEERKSSKKKEKKSKKRNFFVIIIELILLCAIAFSGYKIVLWLKDNNENNTIKDDLESIVITTSEEGKEESGMLDAKNFNINFFKLQQTNNDTIAWVKVNNTSIEYPVVKTTDNDFYLNHNLYKNINGAGWVFADYRNKFDGTDKNIILYGHNRKDGSMFGTLKDTQTKKWYENPDNKNIVFLTPDEKYNYEVFSAYTIQNEDYYITTSFKQGEFGKFVNRLKSRSVYDFGVEVGEDDQILTFSTCSGENYRTVLHAKKIEQETN